MKKVINLIGFTLYVLLITTGCTSIRQTMREPNSKVTFTKNDFTLSPQVTGEAQTVKILCIDWARLFSKKMGGVNSNEDNSMYISAADIPVIGTVFSDKTKNYALYNLLSKNGGYDVVFYPQYETKVVKPFLGLGFITTITRVKATARLGKLKDDYDSPVQKNRPAVRKTENQTNEYNNENSYTTDQATPLYSDESKNETEDELTYETNQPAKPVTGERAFENYIEKNRRVFTKRDDCYGRHGRVILSFKVNERGRPENIWILRSLCASADREAFRLLQDGPDWTESKVENRVEINF